MISRSNILRLFFLMMVFISSSLSAKEQAERLVNNAEIPPLVANAGKDKVIKCTDTYTTVGHADNGKEATSDGATYRWTSKKGYIHKGVKSKIAEVWSDGGTYTLTVSKEGSESVSDSTVIRQETDCHVSTPTPLSPKGNITDRTPTYKWKAVSGATLYYLWSSDSSEKVVLYKGVTPIDAGCENITDTCSLKHSEKLSIGKSGRWHVIASNGKWGKWSSASYYNVKDTNQWYIPEPLTTWQWQLQGEVNTSYDVEVYDIDLFDTSETLIQSLQNNNKKVICYFSGGSYENWRPDEDQFKKNDLGKTLDGWAGERWLDIRSSNVRNIMKKRLDLAKQKGCDGVELDNMDGYTNKPGFRDPPLTFDDQINYNRFIAKEAHDRGLSVGLKNDLEQLDELVDYFDFAVNEQCFEFNECKLLEDTFIKKGKAVFNAEYKRKYIDDPSFCKDSKKMKFSTLILPLDLNDSSRHSCL